MNSGFSTIQDFEYWCNVYGIPMILKSIPELQLIKIMIFNKDKGVVEEALHRYLPMQIHYELLCVSNDSLEKNKNLLDYAHLIE